VKEQTTVAIPTWNSGKTISECLTAITKSFPIVHVYDRFSTDETLPIAKKFGCTIHQNNESLGATRARMIAEAENTFLLMIDSDNVLDPSGATSLLDGFNVFQMKDPTLAAAFLLNVPFWEPMRSYALWDFSRRQFPIKNKGRLDTACVLLDVAKARGFKCEEILYEDWALGEFLKSEGFSFYHLGGAHPIHLLSRKDSYRHWRKGAYGLRKFEGQTPTSMLRKMCEISFTKRIPLRYKPILLRQHWEWFLGLCDL
jgi:glycosyltransferase involved in cell wall biosynthesis